MHHKGIVDLCDRERYLADALDGVVEQSIPGHEGTLTHAADETTIADLNVVPRQFPGKTALAPFHESNLP